MDNRQFTNLVSWQLHVMKSVSTNYNVNNIIISLKYKNRGKGTSLVSVACRSKHYIDSSICIILMYIHLYRFTNVRRI